LLGLWEGGRRRPSGKQGEPMDVANAVVFLTHPPGR